MRVCARNRRPHSRGVECHCSAGVAVRALGVGGGGGKVSRGRNKAAVGGEVKSYGVPGRHKYPGDNGSGAVVVRWGWGRSVAV